MKVQSAEARENCGWWTVTVVALDTKGNKYFLQYRKKLRQRQALKLRQNVVNNKLNLKYWNFSQLELIHSENSDNGNYYLFKSAIGYILRIESEGYDKESVFEEVQKKNYFKNFTGKVYTQTFFSEWDVFNGEWVFHNYLIPRENPKLVEDCKNINLIIEGD